MTPRVLAITMGMICDKIMNKSGITQLFFKVIVHLDKVL